jgi:hypothetical protein
MGQSSKTLFPGLLLIVIGIIFLLPNVTDLRGRDLWPLLVLGTGVVFYAVFLKDRSNYGLLMPATILTIIGCMFLYCTIEGWHMMSQLWPLFIIAPGLGFALMYFFGKKEKGLLIPGGILLAIGFVFLIGFGEFDYLLPVILIVAGCLLIFKEKLRGKVN